MTKDEAINGIINLFSDIGKAEHRDLWHYEQALSEIKGMLETEQQLCDDAMFWRKRANEYENQCLELITEMNKGVKVDSIRIDKDGIFFEKKQPEQQWTLCDKMPDKPGVYLTLRVGYGVERYEVLRYSPSVGFCRYSEEDGEYYSVPVHAWMPIEPWRGEEP